MKYLVNRETKEHTPLSGDGGRYSDLYFDVVEADDEGWIAWSGGECPLPDEAKCEVKTHGSGLHLFERPSDYQSDWAGYISFYRPILSETAEKEELPQSLKAAAEYLSGQENEFFEEWLSEIAGNVTARNESVFDRLKSAIAASESIPGIIAEIDALLPEGYCVVQSVQPPSLDLQPAEDMSDWRNWMEGDLIECVNDLGWSYFVRGKIYKFGKTGDEVVRCAHVESFPGDFRFHSRPAKVAE